MEWRSLAQWYHPEREDIDAGIGLAVEPQRSRDTSGSVFGVPRFDPGAQALFEARDDLRGDVAVRPDGSCCWRRSSCSLLFESKFFSSRNSVTPRAFVAARSSHGRAQRVHLDL